MRVGIVTPVLTLLPGAHGRWERDAGIEEVARIAETADRLGYDHMTCSEHVAVPASVALVRGATYWDPLATLGFVAARTSRLRLATGVLVLGYHHPLEIAKRYGTLDRVSGGRLILGVGVGSLEEEFALLGAPFADRGARADSALGLIHSSMSSREPAAYPGFIVDPCAVQERVPIWIGGRTRRSLRRAVELADGWMPFGLSPGALADMLARVDLPAGFEAVLAADRALDPMAGRSRVEDTIGELAAAGATILSARIFSRSLDHYLEQLESLASVAL
jgi:probable F420-dependent oxidoreductase